MSQSLNKRVCTSMFLVIFVLLTYCQAAHSDTQSPKQLVAARTDKSPVIDGKLDDACWQQASQITDFSFFTLFNWSSIIRQMHNEQTVGRVCYDQNNLYLAFECKVLDMAKFRKRQAETNGKFDYAKGSVIEVFIDTNHDRKTFDRYPLHSNGSFSISVPSDDLFDILNEGYLKSKAVLTDTGFTIESVIPFATLRLRPGTPKIWGFNLRRVHDQNDSIYDANGLYSSWNSTQGKREQNPECFGELAIDEDFSRYFWKIDFSREPQAGDKTIGLRIENQTSRDFNGLLAFSIVPPSGKEANYEKPLLLATSQSQEIVFEHAVSVEDAVAKYKISLTNSSEQACYLVTKKLKVAKRPITAFPQVGKYEVLRGDFHIHTLHSDGYPTARERVLEAWKYGYDTIAITDHANFEEQKVGSYRNYYQTYQDALVLAKSLGIILINGLETGIINDEHYVALGFSTKYESKDEAYWELTENAQHAFYQDRLRDVKKAGGLVIYAHPGEGLQKHTLWGVEKGLIQGVEVFNAFMDAYYQSPHGNRWFNGVLCYPDAFKRALKYDLAIIASSDAHGFRGEIEKPVGQMPALLPTTLLFVKERSEKGVMDAIRYRRTVAWFGGMLWGREKLLADLINNVVKVKYTEDEGKNGWLRIQNLGPVALKAMLPAHLMNEEVEIDPYNEVLLKCIPTRDTFSIRWGNIWISPTENLITTYKPAY